MPLLSLSGVMPNLCLILVTSSGLLGGEKTGLVSGLLAGMLIDILFAPFAGFYTLCYGLMGSISGEYTRDMRSEHLMLPLFLVCLFEGVMLTAEWLLFAVIRNEVVVMGTLFLRFIPEFLYTAIVTLPLYSLYWLLASFCKWLDPHRRILRRAHR